MVSYEYGGKFLDFLTSCFQIMGFAWNYSVSPRIRQ